MKILAFDTSGSACSVALLLDNEITTSHQHAPMQQAQLILPMIDELLRLKKIALTELDAIAFGRGPGSFTGVRIATSVAQGLGFALNIPLLPISSLAAAAQNVHDRLGWKKILVAMDARMKEIYYGIYEVNSHGLVELINQELICSPETLLESEGNGTGNAWRIYENQFLFKPPHIDDTGDPEAAALVKLAKFQHENQKGIKAIDALPVYLRDKVAVKEKTR